MSGARSPAIPPAAPQASQKPGFVSSDDKALFHAFQGIDTKSPRPAIDDRQCYWMDGLMPVGPSFLRILPGIGPAIYGVSPPGSAEILWHQYGVIGSSPDPGDVLETDIGPRYYGVVLLSDGSVQAFNTDTGEVRGIMLPGTIQVPRTQFGFSQWSSDYFLFVKDQPNGYWIWDEHNTFTAGTFSPIITLTSGGRNYTSPPNIQVQTTGSGGGVAFQAILTPGSDSVERVIVTNPGAGFGVSDLALLKFSGGGSDTTAWGVANIGAGGGVKEVVVTNGGHGYTAASQVVFSGGGGTGASAAPNIQNGTIIGVTIVSPGVDYTSAPAVTITDPGGGGISGGTGFSGYAVNGLNGISSVGITNQGSGYTTVPDVQIIGDGSGALVQAQISGGGVVGINVINPGEGYTQALPLISGGNNAAAADNWQQLLMPFGWSGTTIEVFESRVWIANGAARADFPPRARLIWSAPGNPADASLGAGSALGTDDFLKVGWFFLKQSNGFLYLIGDSSINAISNVQTATTGATQGTATTPPDPGTVTTSFSNQNVDPQIGSPWPSSVQALSRSLIFANSNGIHVSYGGAVQKVSQALDGIFPVSAEIYGRQADFSSAVAQVFGIQVYCLLIPHADLYNGGVVNTLIMFDEKSFWTSPQDVQLTYIASQEILSQMVAWGTDGSTIFRLFQRPTTAFAKVVRSKLWDNPGYDWTKTGVRLYGIFQDFPLDQPVMVDIENSTGPAARVQLQSTDPGMQTFGTAVWGPYPTGQFGRLMGLTLHTNATQGNLVSILLRQADFVFDE